MKKNVVKIASLMIMLNLLSKILGFARDYLTAIKFGTSCSADAYLMATNIPNILFVIIGVSITTTFVPIYNKAKESEDNCTVLKMTNNILNILLIVSILFFILLEIFAPILIKIMAPGFLNQKYNLTVFLTRIVSGAIILNTLISLFTSILQCEENFLLPVSIGIPYNIILILYFTLFSTKFGVVGLTIMLTFALISQVLILIIGLKRLNFKYIFYINFKDRNLKNMLKLILPICIGTGMTQLNGIFNGIFASSLRTGSVAAINYAIKLHTLIIDVIIMTIITITYQRMSKAFAKKQLNKICVESNQSIIIMFIILIPIVSIILIYCKYIVKFLFQKGAFNSDSTYMTSQAFYYYSLNLFATAINTILSRICFSFGNTKLPMEVTIYGITLNIILGYILKNILGIGGIALASTLGVIFSTLILYLKVKKFLPNCITWKTISTLKKLILCSVPMIIFLVYCKNNTLNIYSSNNVIELLKMGVIFFTSIILYLCLVWIFKIKEINFILKLLLKNKTPF